MLKKATVATSALLAALAIALAECKANDALFEMNIDTPYVRFSAPRLQYGWSTALEATELRAGLGELERPECWYRSPHSSPILILPPELSNEGTVELRTVTDGLVNVVVEQQDDELDLQVVLPAGTMDECQRMTTYQRRTHRVHSPASRAKLLFQPRTDTLFEPQVSANIEAFSFQHSFSQQRRRERQSIRGLVRVPGALGWEPIPLSVRDTLVFTELQGVLGDVMVKHNRIELSLAGTGKGLAVERDGVGSTSIMPSRLTILLHDYLLKDLWAVLSCIVLAAWSIVSRDTK